jgi:hypothetical protein
MTEPFDFEEARRLAERALAIEGELTDLEAWGREIDEDYMFARIKRDREAQERAGEESQRLAALCTRRALMWDGLAAALDVQDLSVVREMTEAICQTAADGFRRLEGGWSS